MPMRGGFWLEWRTFGRRMLGAEDPLAARFMRWAAFRHPRRRSRNQYLRMESPVYVPDAGLLAKIR